MRYQVFIEGARDPSALSSVAEAIAARYRLPAATVAQRMTAGRFRVKSGIDQATAERLAKDLEGLGAVCVIEDEAGQALPRPGAAPAPAPQAAAPGSPAPQPDPSGVSAPMGRAQQDLGVLSGDSASFTLATLDGEEDRPPDPGSQAATAYAPSDFAPPDAEEQDLQLAVDISKPPPRAPTPVMAADSSSSAGITVPMPPSVAPPPSSGSQTSITFEGPGEPAEASAPAAPARPSAQHRAVSAGGDAGAPRANPFEKVRSMLASSERVRFAVGVFAALLIGFLPAHLIASVRESSAFGEIDAEVRAEQAQVEDVETWNTLDEFRKAQLERKESKQTGIALGSVVIWALLGGGLGFLWFRKIDWDRYREPA